MMNSIFRKPVAILLTLCALTLAACEPLPPGAVNEPRLLGAVNSKPFGPSMTNEQAFGPAATGADIKKYISDTTFLSLEYGQRSKLHFGSDGSLHIFGGVFSVAVGKWRVERVAGMDLLIQERTRTELEYDHATETYKVITSKDRASYKVFIRPDEFWASPIGLSLDEIVNGKFEGVTKSYDFPKKGFPGKAEFESAQRDILAGKKYSKGGPGGGELAAGLLFCVATALLLCM